MFKGNYSSSSSENEEEVHPLIDKALIVNQTTSTDHLVCIFMLIKVQFAIILFGNQLVVVQHLGVKTSSANNASINGSNIQIDFVPHANDPSPKVQYHQSLIPCWRVC